MKAARVFACSALTLLWISTAIAADGAEVFAEICQACHQAGGVGAPGVAPPLVSSVLATAATRQPDYPVRVVTSGLSGTLELADGETITSAMPPQPQLSDEQIAAVVGYVFRLNETTTAIQPGDVARIRSQPIDNAGLRRLRAGLTP